MMKWLIGSKALWVAALGYGIYSFGHVVTGKLDALASAISL